MGKKAKLDLTPEQRAAMVRMQERLRKSPLQTENQREQMRLIGQKFRLPKVTAPQPEATSRKKRKRGGGNKPMLSDEDVERGKRFFLRMLDEDPTWAQNKTASAKRVVELMKLKPESWWTVKRWVIEPVLKETEQNKRPQRAE